MPIIDSKTKEIRKDYSIEELVEKAKEMRAYKSSGQPGIKLRLSM